MKMIYLQVLVDYLGKVVCVKALYPQVISGACVVLQCRVNYFQNMFSITLIIMLLTLAIQRIHLFHCFLLSAEWEVRFG